MPPVDQASRIESLDVLRGFALLGILLLNIIGFGLHSAAYSNPGFDLTNQSGLDLAAWVSVELFAEGAMRCLFSMLFGAGVVLFTTGKKSKSGAEHYKRTFWLLIFGLFDAYVLLWNGDILVTYAIAGALLYWFRDYSVRKLLIIAGVIIGLMSALHLALGFVLGEASRSAEIMANTKNQAGLSSYVIETAAVWDEFVVDFAPTDEAVAEEMAQRRDSYWSAFFWNAGKSTHMITEILPMFLIWDALAMMIIGMALYKAGVLQGECSSRFYVRLMVIGFTIGLLTNAYEVLLALRNNFNLLSIFAQTQPTYHIGRLGMCLGYIGLIVWLTREDVIASVRHLLAGVGRMALTNYLMQSLICAIVFTGLGFSQVGELSRVALYPVVFGIWVFQLFFSQWWLKRYRFGPIEWLWRAFTYGERPPFVV
ncbi:MAG: DUF418 domain-containing protein [bacterium]|nr:DUF418 domain-containing protein [Gammaproteobacteria bacterium]HIL98848.1 DUF418 domain-containing protein [Pseudomonadales bacterium]